MGVDTADSSTDHKVRPSESKFHTMIPSAIVSDSVPHSSQPAVGSSVWTRGPLRFSQKLKRFKNFILHFEQTTDRLMGIGGLLQQQ